MSAWRIVDEAHKMSAYADDRKTLAYRLGESPSGMTDHYLLMTTTPHKGDAENFCRFLALLDRDVYGNVGSLEDAMRRGTPRSTSAAPRRPWSPSPTPTPGRSRNPSLAARSRRRRSS